MNHRQEPLVVYGTRWCPACTRVKRFLEQRTVPFRWIDLAQNPEAADYVERINDGYRSVPTIVFPDGSILTEPTNRELAHKLETAF